MQEMIFDFATKSHSELQRMNRHVYARYRDDLCMLVRYDLARFARVERWPPRAPGQGMRKVDGPGRPAQRRQLVIVRCSSRELDKGNFIGGCKPLLDALVLEGVLFDDSPAWLDDHYHQVRVKRAMSRTVVRFGPMIEPPRDVGSVQGRNDGNGGPTARILKRYIECAE